MYVRYLGVTLPVMALALSMAGVVPASTIHVDDRPAQAPTDSASWTIAGDYTAFDDNSALFGVGDGSPGERAITLSFEFTSGYAPDAEVIDAVRALVSGE